LYSFIHFWLVHFTIDFLDSLTLEQVAALEGVVLPPKATQLTNMEVDEREETTLHDVDIEEMRRKHA
jgi:DnaJ family protein A protein 2